ncbi:protein-serine/threonine phosphatase [Salvia divinorum]|uniref:Protein-serine/threonine phosphatase n=1 Tax=Salvia divinorum TaxID=28513 RepID=A0ABD1GLD3_SALDI
MFVHYSQLCMYAKGVKSPEMPVMFVPSIRSGGFADIGPRPRRYMEDEHIRIDDLSAHLELLITVPQPSAFYGVFYGHGGPEAAAYVRKQAMRFFFEDDMALAEDSSISSSSGMTALTALVVGRLLMVANAGDCQAVLCRKGEAIDMFQDHRPSYALERRRVEELGGFIDDGYLNGVLSVTQALGDWDMKLLQGSTSPLIQATFNAPEEAVQPRSFLDEGSNR